MVLFFFFVVLEIARDFAEVLKTILPKYLIRLKKAIKFRTSTRLKINSRCTLSRKIIMSSSSLYFLLS